MRSKIITFLDIPKPMVCIIETILENDDFSPLSIEFLFQFLVKTRPFRNLPPRQNDFQYIWNLWRRKWNRSIQLSIIYFHLDIELWKMGNGGEGLGVLGECQFLFISTTHLINTWKSKPATLGLCNPQLRDLFFSFMMKTLLPHKVI